ncbi:hypothetical protein GBA65_13595 [Rubrobacter marinus]|uniref:Uncharacterized protein n=1 Tax=Rubrobacter marinus TaxID=2653852 RepID=A0A6G8PYX0_9ACTN|nr:hypothetical protein [Rubrobacter marinus]QIN79375.1 hypothetical protein GBA65_13595 [Rubrobacter marinus]
MQDTGLDAYGPRSGEAPAEASLEQGVGLVVVAAVLSLVAALVHLWMVPGYAWIWWGYGVFFLSTALAQGLLGVALLRWPAAPVVVAGISGNLAVMLLYVFTRTSGVPFGPHAGKVEDAGLLDMTATLAEMGLVVLLVTLLSGAYRRVVINALLLLGAAVWALRLLGGSLEAPPARPGPARSTFRPGLLTASTATSAASRVRRRPRHEVGEAPGASRGWTSWWCSRSP